MDRSTCRRPLADMRLGRSVQVGLLLGLMIGVAPPAVSPQNAGSEYQGATALGLALRQLGTTKRVLMIGAHPDDENTALLSTLALKQGADVAYLSLTRGEGGQNLLGPELGEALGLIRSEELLAARRLDGAQQFFTRAYEFGFSKSADEAFRHWPRDSILGDVVAVIRKFRPQVVLTIFSGTPRDGHGHHQAAGILAREAYAAAGDPTRFPEQIERGLRPYAPQALFQALWGRSEGGSLVATGELDPLLGRSHHQVAMASRSRHRSQDMGQAQLPGPQFSRVERIPLESHAGNGNGAPEGSALFAGIDTTLAGRVRVGKVANVLAAFDARVARLRREFNPLAPGALVPGLAESLKMLRQADSLLAGSTGAEAAELRFLLAAENADAQDALAQAAGVVLDGVAGDERVVAGQSFPLELTLWNGGDRPVRVAALAPVLPAGWQATPADSVPRGSLAPGALLTRRFAVRVPPDARVTEPYFLRRPRDGDLYPWPADPDTAGRPFEPSPVRAEARVEIDGAAVPLEREATFREIDQVLGELRHPVLIVPAVSVRLEPDVAVLPTGGTARAQAAPLRYRVRLAAEARQGIAGTLRIQPPPGWRVDPATVPMRFGKPGEERTVEVIVHPPAGVAPGDYGVEAVFETEGGARFQRGFQAVSYPHIRTRLRYDPAVSRVRALDLRIPTGLRIGYIRGASDQVPEALMRLGLQVDLLHADSLAAGNLDRYSTIVVGSRAYEVRPDLVANHRRLLEFAERGGTLLVQYQQYQFVQGGFAPHPLTIARPHDRVTDEAAPVRLLQPTHPVLSRPNRITAQDFKGWIQDQGLYFARDWDARYTPLLEMADPGESPLRGGLLVAPYGKGTYVYTGLAFFRQLPEGVPGAYRLFVNLLALGAKQ